MPQQASPMWLCGSTKPCSERWGGKSPSQKWVLYVLLLGRDYAVMIWLHDKFSGATLYHVVFNHT